MICVVEFVLLQALPSLSYKTVQLNQVSLKWSFASDDSLSAKSLFAMIECSIESSFRSFIQCQNALTPLTDGKVTITLPNVTQPYFARLTTVTQYKNTTRLERLYNVHNGSSFCAGMYS